MAGKINKYATSKILMNAELIFFYFLQSRTLSYNNLVITTIFKPTFPYFTTVLIVHPVKYYDQIFMVDGGRSNGVTLYLTELEK